MNCRDSESASGPHWLILLAAILMMLAGTAYPLLFARSDGHANHGLALLFFWAMSAGFVRGVGFIPRYWLWRRLLSGSAFALALALACWDAWL
jgi:predicted membrane protein